MPKRHCILFFFVFFLSLFLASRSALHERVFLYVLHQIESEALEPVKKDELLAGAFVGMVQTAPDYPYTSWLPLKEKIEYEGELQGKIGGIGIFHLRKELPSGEFSFIPLPATPASKAGLQYGDRIVKVDNTDVSKYPIMEILGLLRGDQGTSVSLSIRRPGSKELKNIKIVRDTIQQEIICGDYRNPDGSWNFTLEDDPSIGYIKITQFADLTVPLFDLAVNSIVKKEAKGIILDFRGNPGGFLPAAAGICDYFLPAGSKIVTTRRRDGSVKREFFASAKKKVDLPLVVLIDEGSASASEIVSACLQDYKRAAIVGSRSYGKGTVQELFPLPCGMGLLRLTDASFWRPSGVPLHRFHNSKDSDPWGVHPDPNNEIPLSEFQSIVLRWIQDLRGSLDADQAKLAIANVLKEMESFRKRVQSAKTKIELKKIYQDFGLPYSEEQNPESESKTDQKKTFELPDLKLEGKDPRFDPQLDRAIQVLKNQ
ncbi:MAG: S41 family peptidase [Planctomycetia bacterium]|nr:S41 family peptidase [Planctomycetia bacterium]